MLRLRWVGISILATAWAAGCAMDDPAADKSATDSTPGMDVTNLGSADHLGDPDQGGLALDGAPVGGTLSRQVPYHTRSFEAEAGQSFAFEAAGGRRGDDTLLIVYGLSDAGWVLEAYNDDCGPGGLDSCLEWSSETGGSYLLAVTTYEYGFLGRPARAQYELTASCLSCASECPDPDDPTVHYAFDDPEICARALIHCEDYQEFFGGECGCGCVDVGPAPSECDEDVERISTDPDQCAAIRFMCAPGFRPVFDDCGCGCAPDCVVGGCSSQVCHEAGETVITTCEWREEYACYREATCERQTDGACGWTPTDELLACLDSGGGWGPIDDGSAPDDGSGDGSDAGGCQVGGCSSQVCHEAGETVFTTCEWREEYACYQNAACERQSDGACGWTMTDELAACLGGS